MLQECLLAGHKMVKLIIRVDVALWENTQFLNMHSDGSYSIDKTPNLQKDRAELTEIIVKDSIPVEYIQNIGYLEKVQPILYFYNCNALEKIYVPAKKTDYYKRRLPERLHSLIVELQPEKKAKKR